MANAPIEVTPELVRSVDTMSWRGYLKLLGLGLVPLILYHILFHTGGDSGGIEGRLDALETRTAVLEQQVQDHVTK